MGEGVTVVSTYPKKVYVSRGTADGEGGVDGRVTILREEGVEQSARVTDVPVLRHHLNHHHHYHCHY